MALDTWSWSHVLWAFLAARVAQRLYYFARGHVHYYSLDARAALADFLLKHGVAFSAHDFACSRDGTTIKYSLLGTGPRLVLLCNGVGTDLYMWLPLLRCMLAARPSIFADITLVAPSYRGLFGSDRRSGEEVEVTMNNCAEDLPEILAHVRQSPLLSPGKRAGADKGKPKAGGRAADKNTAAGADGSTAAAGFDSVVGWSMGAQTALTCMSRHPSLARKLLLLNPSSGQALHSVLQPVVPMPEAWGRVQAYVIRTLIGTYLRPLISTWVWGVLQAVARSVVFRVLLEAGSFFGGYPPEQANYFHCYMKDVFATRNQTRGLLDLIVALDSPLPSAALTLPNRTHIISGYPDIMTGVYHSNLLHARLRKSTHSVYTMVCLFAPMFFPSFLPVFVCSATSIYFLPLTTFRVYNP